MRSAIGVDVDIHGFSHTDSVAHLYQHLVSHTRCHHILGDMTGSIGRRAVNLRGVLSGESATAVGSFASVGIDNNLTTRQPRISMRSANDELTRRVDIVFNVIAKEGEYLLRMDLRFNTRYQDIDDILTNLSQHTLIIAVKLIMLG